jgi:hypothetical protein
MSPKHLILVALSVCLLLSAISVLEWLTSEFYVFNTELSSLGINSIVGTKFNTAVGQIVVVMSSILFLFKLRHAATYLGVVPVFIGMMTAISYLGIDGPNIDEIFVTETDIQPGTSHPGRMSPLTAVCFVLSGLSTIITGGLSLTKHRSAARLVGWLHSTTIVTAIYAMLVLGLRALSAPAVTVPFTDMAILTALIFIVNTLASMYILNRVLYSNKQLDFYIV